MKNTVTFECPETKAPIELELTVLFGVVQRFLDRLILQGKSREVANAIIATLLYKKMSPVDLHRFSVFLRGSDPNLN